MTSYKVAVLDDYHGIADSFFSSLPKERFAVTVFRDTLPSYSHSDTGDSDRDALVERLAPFHIISTMRERTPFPGPLLARLPNLKLLLTTGARNASLDLPAFTARNIPVIGTNTKLISHPKPVGPDSTTQHTVALILALARNIAQDAAAVKTGQWQSEFATGLAGRKFGVVGLGRLGAAVAKIMHVAFGMEVIAWSSNMTQESADKRAQELGISPDLRDANGKTFRVVSKEELFSTADVVSIHLVLSERSRGVIAASDLALMKPSSLFINTSRGPLVVENDLLETLRAGKIRGAALDVFDVEPLPLDSEWRSKDWGKNGRSHVLVTPHMGYVEEEVFRSWYGLHVEKIQRWADGGEDEDRLA